MIARLAIATLATIAALAAALAGATPAIAAPSQTTIQGQVLRLVSIQDAEAMAAMVPGVPTVWDVGVSAGRPDGAIELQLEVDATDDAFDATVSSCPTAWTADGCGAGAATIVDAQLVDGVLSLGAQPAAEERWYRVAVVLTADLGEHRADLVFRATGMGDDVASGGQVELPQTGSEPPVLGLVLAGTAVMLGLLLAGAAWWRRQTGDR